MQPTTHQLPAPINGLAWNAEGENSSLAAISGAGSLHLIRPGLLTPHAVPISPGQALLGLIATPHGFATSNEAGEVHLTTTGGEPALLAQTKYAFLEHLAYHPKTQKIYAATGKTLSAISLTGTQEKLSHTLPSTIAGLAMSPIGPRLAASHYGGANIFALDAPKTAPRLLPWKGSHLALTYSPDGKWLISAMQEQAIHLWRLSDGMDLQMRGYPGKISQFSWNHTGQLLATNGGSGVPLWSFADKLKGPAGTQAQVIAESSNPELLVTAVAMHPTGQFCATGYADGLVLLANIADNRSVLLHEPTESPATHLAWSPTGMHLAAAHATGRLTVTDFTTLA